MTSSQNHNLLTADVIRHSQAFTAFCATSCQYFTAAYGFHSFPETVFVSSFAVGGLECSFHDIFLWLFLQGRKDIDLRLKIQVKTNEKRNYRKNNLSDPDFRHRLAEIDLGQFVKSFGCHAPDSAHHAVVPVFRQTLEPDRAIQIGQGKRRVD